MGLEGCISSTGKKIVILKKKERKDGEIKNCVILDSNQGRVHTFYTFLTGELDHMYTFSYAVYNLSQKGKRNSAYRHIRDIKANTIILNAESTPNSIDVLKEIKTEFSQSLPVVLLSHSTATIANRYFNQQKEIGVAYMLELPFNVSPRSVETLKINIIRALLNVYYGDFPKNSGEFYLQC